MDVMNEYLHLVFYFILKKTVVIFLFKASAQLQCVRTRQIIFEMVYIVCDCQDHRSTLAYRHR